MGFPSCRKTKNELTVFGKWKEKKTMEEKEESTPTFDF